MIAGPDLTARFAAVFQPGNGIFSPNYPLVPVEPEQVRVRDFVPGWNINYQPRHEVGAGIGFPELRALAENHDITRLCIETRKDQIEKLDWTINSIEEDAPEEGADSRIKTLKAFWQKPDGETPFPSWLRMIVEDMLVIDAATLEVRRSRGGQIIGLDVVDGSTIKLLLDNTGRRPMAPAPAYEQVIRGRPWRLMTTDDIVYAPRNRRPWKSYGYSPCEQIITTVNIGLRRQIMQLQHFTEGNVPAGILNAAEGWTSDQIHGFQELFDSYLAGNTGARTKVIWVPSGTKFQAFKEAPYKDQFDEWLARIVCYAFSLPPTPFIERSPNRSTSETLQEAALEEGMAPLLGWVKRLIDSVIQDRMGHKDLEFSWNAEQPMEPEDQAKVIDSYVRNGTYTINQALEILGEVSIGPDGDHHLIYTGAGPVKLDDVLNPPPLPPAVGGTGAPGVVPTPRAPTPSRRPNPGGARGRNGQSSKPKPASKLAAAMSRLRKGTRDLDPEYSRPVRLPVADDDTRADVEHIAWQEERKRRVAGDTSDFPTRVVPMSSIVATQPDVDERHVEKDEEEYRSNGGYDEPPITVFMNGHYFIVDGHHRVAGAQEAGAREMEVSYITDSYEPAVGKAA